MIGEYSQIRSPSLVDTMYVSYRPSVYKESVFEDGSGGGIRPVRGAGDFLEDFTCIILLSCTHYTLYAYCKNNSRVGAMNHRHLLALPQPLRAHGFAQTAWTPRFLHVRSTIQRRPVLTAPAAHTHRSATLFEVPSFHSLLVLQRSHNSTRCGCRRLPASPGCTRRTRAKQ